MFMSVIDNSLTSARYGELAGVRVLVSGLSAAHGVDIARAFADHKARLIVQSDTASSPEGTEVMAMLSETAHEIKVFDESLAVRGSAQRFAQTASQAFGSLDTAINIIPVSAAEITGLSDLEQIEDFVARKLEPALAITRTSANRMRLMLTEGLVLNVLMVSGPTGRSGGLVLQMLRSALAGITRKEAEAWAGSGIRINAIAPKTSLPGETGAAALASEPEMAAVALYLASKRARGLSGHVFDAEGALTTCG